DFIEVFDHFVALLVSFGNDLMDPEQLFPRQFPLLLHEQILRQRIRVFDHFLLRLAEFLECDRFRFERRPGWFVGASLASAHEDSYDHQHGCNGTENFGFRLAEIKASFASRLSAWPSAFRDSVRVERDNAARTER